MPRREMKGIFIAGTDTYVGKTQITALCARYLVDKGLSVITQKWIQTGTDGKNEDIYSHIGLLPTNRKKYKAYSSFMCPYVFSYPAAPHIAAQREKEIIQESHIRKAFFFLVSHFEWIIVEGTGGVLVPLRKGRYLIDIVKDLKLPVILVVDNKLGALNHTFLSIEALQKRRIPLLGIILNNACAGRDTYIAKGNADTLQKWSGCPLLGEMPFTRKEEKMIEYFQPIGKKIFGT